MNEFIILYFGMLKYIMIDIIKFNILLINLIILLYLYEKLNYNTYENNILSLFLLNFLLFQ